MQKKRATVGLRLIDSPTRKTIVQPKSTTSEKTYIRLQVKQKKRIDSTAAAIETVMLLGFTGKSNKTGADEAG